MKKFILPVIILTLVVINLQAVFEFYPTSARARGMANAFFTLSDDPDAIFYNPAGLDGSDPQINVGYAKLYNNKYLTLGSVSSAVKLPNNWGTIALGGKQLAVDFEDENLSNESTYSIAHAFKIVNDIHSQIAFGYTLNYFNLEFDQYGSDSAFGFNLGAIATLHRRTKLSFAFLNLNNPTVGKNNEHELPRKMVTGIAYQPYFGVITTCEISKELEGDTMISGGIEYTLVKNLMKVRAGVHNNPATYSAGASFDVFNCLVDYGYTYHSDLDATHHISLGYKF